MSGRTNTRQLEDRYPEPGLAQRLLP